MHVHLHEARADIVLLRQEDGTTSISVDWVVRHYGVAQMDWGYVGPAPAELALNILNNALPVGVDGEDAIDCEQGRCSAICWRLHRSFMADVLVRIPYEGARLGNQEIRRWILSSLSDELAPSD